MKIRYDLDIDEISTITWYENSIKVYLDDWLEFELKQNLEPKNGGLCFASSDIPPNPTPELWHVARNLLLSAITQELAKAGYELNHWAFRKRD